jgi:sugar (pentulose or hexulose) kinase
MSKISFYILGDYYQFEKKVLNRKKIYGEKKIIPVDKTFTPNMETKKVYDKYYEVYKNLYASNKKNFALLNS